MQRSEVSGAVRPIYMSLGVKRLKNRIYVATILFKLVNPTNKLCNKGSAQNAGC